MTSGINVKSTAVVLVAGLAMWDAWEKYQEEGGRTWRNLIALLIRVVAFAAAIQSEVTSLPPTVRNVLVAAAEALMANVQQLRFDFPTLRLD
jgi:hypothetical protein